MNDIKNNNIKKYSVAAVVLSVIGIVLHTVCMFFFYDEDIGYYSKGVFSIAFIVFCVLCVAAFWGFAFFRKDAGKELKVVNCCTALSSLASALAMLAFFGYFYISIIDYPVYYYDGGHELLSEISALVALVYFAMNLIPTSNKKIQCLCGFGIIIWNVYILAVSYFDIMVTLNSPAKIWLHLAIASAMLFFIAELRTLVSSVSRRYYLFSLYTALFINGVMSVASVVYGVVRLGEFYLTLKYDIVFLSFFFYFLSRAVEVMGMKDEKEKNADNVFLEETDVSV